MNVFLYIADIAPLQQSAVFDRLYATLPPVRQQKVDRLRTIHSRCLSLGAGLLLQQACREQGYDGADGEMAYLPHGKPVLAHSPHLHFNLAHAGQRVCCAVCDTEIGCDVEPIDKPRTALAERIFSPQEVAWLHEQAEEAEAFYRLWTLKESYLKMTGQGLSLPMKHFSLLPDGNRHWRITAPENATAMPTMCRFYEVAPQDGYRYACCVQGDAARTLTLLSPTWEALLPL